MNHDEQNTLIIELINSKHAELKGDIAEIDKKLGRLQEEYDAVLKAQTEMLITQKATKRIVKWCGGAITFMIALFELINLIMAVI